MGGARVCGRAAGSLEAGATAPAATRLADRVVFTEEDHRDTPLAEILAEMERGAREAGQENFTSIGDRREAIRHAVVGASAGDTVLLAGKGPEDTLERDGVTVPWDEVAEAREALTLRG